MTTPTQSPADDVLRVEQRHRDAAEGLLRYLRDEEGHSVTKTGLRAILEGGWDREPEVQAFARFERDLLASRPDQGEVERLREDIADLIKRNTASYDDAAWWWDIELKSILAGDYERSQP